MEHNVRRTGDLSRLRGTLAGFFQQADLLLLGLCCLATLYGMALIASATRYMDTSGMIRYVGVQGVAMLLGIGAYIFMSMVDIEIVMRKWKWIVGFNVVFIGLLVTPLGVEYHRQSGMAEIPRYSLSDRPGGGGEDHLYSVAGQAAGMAAGRKARLKILSFCLFGGGTHIGSDGLVRGDLRRYGQCSDVLFHLPVYVLCGRLCLAVVRTAAGRGWSRFCGGLGTGSDPAIHDGSFPSPV